MAPVTYYKCKECKKIIKKKRFSGASLWTDLATRVPRDGVAYQQTDCFCNGCRHQISASGKTLQILRKRNCFPLQADEIQDANVNCNGAEDSQNIELNGELYLSQKPEYEEEGIEYGGERLEHEPECVADRTDCDGRRMEYESQEYTSNLEESQNLLDNVEAVYSSSEANSCISQPINIRQCRAIAGVRRKSAVIHRNKVTLSKVKSVANTENKCTVCKQEGPGSRLRIPDVVRHSFWSRFKVWIPRNNRCCIKHHNNMEFNEEATGKILSGPLKQDADLTEDDIRAVINGYAAKANEKKIDINSPELMEEDYFLLFGINKAAFEEIFNSIKEHLRCSYHRSPKNALAIFLTKFRLGISQKMIGFLFGLPQRKVSKTIARIGLLLEKHFVPKYFGLFQKSRDGYLKENDSEFVRRLYDLPDGYLILVLDGTYLYCEKSCDHRLQKKTFSMQKSRNLLKVMVIVTPTGYIVDVIGIYFSDSHHNDASILLDMLREKNGISKLIKAGDLFILDRGFRDCIGTLNQMGIKTLMPTCKNPSRKTFTTQEANESRLVTLTRWVVESVNGRLKNMFKFFDHIIPHQYFNENCQTKLKRYLSICCAIINRFCPPLFKDTDKHQKLLQIVNEKKDIPNTLLKEIEENQKDFLTGRKCWQNYIASDLKDFPRLSLEELEMICLGKFNLKNAQGYTDEHIRLDQQYHLQCHKVRPGLLRVKLNSKYRGSTAHFQWIEYNVTGEGEKILRYCCQCMGGSKTLGCCSHVSSILWYLGYQRHNSPTYKPRNFGQDILDVVVRKVANNESYGESDDDENLDGSSSDED